MYASSVANSGPVRPSPACRRSASTLSSGRNSSRPLQLAVSLQFAQVAGVHVQHGRSPARGRPPGRRSARSCRAGPARRPRRSCRGRAGRAARSVSSPSRTTWSSRILMLTSWSEVSTPAELSMKSVLTRPPPRANSMRARWVRPRLPPSPTTLQRSSVASARSTSLARSPTSAWVSRGRLDVGADAAVPHQVDGRAQDRVDQLVRGHRGHAVGDAERLAYLRRQRDLLGRTRVDPAALGDQRGVVVGPRAARQREHPLALDGTRTRGVRRRGRGRCAGGRRRR